MSRNVVKIVIAKQVLIRGKTSAIAFGFVGDWIYEVLQAHFRFCKGRESEYRAVAVVLKVWYNFYPSRSLSIRDICHCPGSVCFRMKMAIKKIPMFSNPSRRLPLGWSLVTSVVL